MIADFIKLQRELIAYYHNPAAWVIIATPIWASSGTFHPIALFDSKEKANAYLKGSALPYPIKDTSAGHWRYFKSVSLLWDYLSPNGLGSMVGPASPIATYTNIPHNPTLPLSTEGTPCASS